MKKRVLVLLGIFCLLAVSSKAWWQQGHFVVADIAYQSLSDSNRVVVDGLLASHPEYVTWSNVYQMNPALHSISLGEFVFASASVWADDIKNKTSPYYNTDFNHYNRHFVDYPLVWPAFLPDKTRPAPTDDAIYGIQVCENDITNLALSNYDRAAYLAVLVHYIGDVHQPLHCANFFKTNSLGADESDLYTNGDAGGNLFRVMTSPGVTNNLHAIWDSALGSDTDFTIQTRATAASLLTAYPRSVFPQLAADTNAESWCWESRNLAVTNCYRYAGIDVIGKTNYLQTQLLPAGYLANVTDVSRRQVTLGGYRLADEIARLFPTRIPPRPPQNPRIIDSSP